MAGGDGVVCRSHDVIVTMMHLFLDVLNGVFQILEVLSEIVDEILHVVQLLLGVVVVLSQLADFSHHVVDAVVEVSLILLETIDESDEAVVAVNLNVGIVVYQHAAERDSEQEDDHGVDHVTEDGQGRHGHDGGLLLTRPQLRPRSNI